MTNDKNKTSSSRNASSSGQTRNLDDSDISSKSLRTSQQDVQSQTPRRGASTTGDAVRGSQTRNNGVQDMSKDKNMSSRDDASFDDSEESLNDDSDLARSTDRPGNRPGRDL